MAFRGEEGYKEQPTLFRAPPGLWILDELKSFVSPQYSGEGQDSEYILMWKRLISDRCLFSSSTFCLSQSYLLLPVYCKESLDIKA